MELEMISYRVKCVKFEGFSCLFTMWRGKWSLKPSAHKAFAFPLSPTIRHELSAYRDKRYIRLRYDASFCNIVASKFPNWKYSKYITVVRHHNVRQFIVVLLRLHINNNFIVDISTYFPRHQHKTDLQIRVYVFIYRTWFETVKWQYRTPFRSFAV